MLACTETVTAPRRAAATHGCVTSIGKVRVGPGGVNAIPSAVTGWLDARGADEHAVRAAVGDVASTAESLGGTVSEESWTPATRFDPDLAARLRSTLGGTEPDGIPVLGTG